MVPGFLPCAPSFRSALPKRKPPPNRRNRLCPLVSKRRAESRRRGGSHDPTRHSAKVRGIEPFAGRISSFVVRSEPRIGLFEENRGIQPHTGSKNPMYKYCVWAALVCGCGTSGHAQSSSANSGTIHGSVLDPSGAAIK